MKRFLAMLLALAMVAPVTIGCGDKKKEQQKTKTTVETEKDGKTTKSTKETKGTVESTTK
jgi:hypothetical protein